MESNSFGSSSAPVDAYSQKPVQTSAGQSPINQVSLAPEAPQSETTPSVIERAEKIRTDMLASEKRVFDKIAQFERQIAENLLSGRVEMVPMKSQEQRDQEKADATIKKYFG